MKSKSIIPENRNHFPKRSEKRQKRNKQKKAASRETLYEAITKREDSFRDLVQIDRNKDRFAVSNELREQFFKSTGETYKRDKNEYRDYIAYKFSNFSHAQLLRYKTWLKKLEETKRGVILLADLGFDDLGMF